MALNAEAKADIISEYQRGSKDTGSTEVQVALLSARINELSEHLENMINKHARNVKLEN